jgi:hypothetical protein
MQALPADVLAAIAACGDAGTRGALGFASPAADAARRLPRSRAPPANHAVRWTVQERVRAHHLSQPTHRLAFPLLRVAPKTAVFLRNVENWSLCVTLIDDIGFDARPYLLFRRTLMHPSTSTWVSLHYESRPVAGAAEAQISFTYGVSNGASRYNVAMPPSVAVRLSGGVRQALRGALLLQWLRAHVRCRLLPALAARRARRTRAAMALPADVLAAIAAYGDAGTRGALGFASPAADAAHRLPRSRAPPPTEALAALVRWRALAPMSALLWSRWTPHWRPHMLLRFAHRDGVARLSFMRSLHFRTWQVDMLTTDDGVLALALMRPAAGVVGGRLVTYRGEFGLPPRAAAHASLSIRAAARSLVLLMWLAAHVRRRLLPALRRRAWGPPPA